jgi:hypothetical protein
MARRSRRRLVGFAVGALVAPALLWLLWRGTGGERASGDAQGARRASPPVTEAPPEPPAGGAAASPAPAGAPAAPSDAAPAAARAPPASALEDSLDGPAWQRSKVAFRTRDLGRLGPYVQSGLDAARRDMEFCYAQATARRDPAPAPEPPPDAEQDATASPARPEPAMLLLYLEAREGALDVVEARTDRRGSSPPELVECCREVLRGMEIKAFGAVPGQRYRVKFRLR